MGSEIGIFRRVLRQYRAEASVAALDPAGSSTALWNLPNSITLLRLGAAPFLLWASWQSKPKLFLWLFGLALLTDLLDGLTARWLRQQSEFGGRLDSWADLTIWLSLPLCGWWLYPELVRPELPFLAMALASYGLAAIYGWIKYRRLTSYHTWAGRVAAWLMAIGVVLLMVQGSSWPLRVALGVVLIAEVEEMIITARSPTWRANVPSLWHVGKQEKLIL